MQVIVEVEVEEDALFPSSSSTTFGHTSEFLRAGFNAEDLKTVVAYLQKEIRASRRNVGALKLSNLLQLDRFKEDLNISKVRLRSAPPSGSSCFTPINPPVLTPAQLQNLRQQAKEAFARLRQQLDNTSNP